MHIDTRLRRFCKTPISILPESGERDDHWPLSEFQLNAARCLESGIAKSSRYS
jgi:hypothetical protein